MSEADRSAFLVQLTRESRDRGLGGGFETVYEDPEHHLFGHPYGSHKAYFIPPDEIAHPRMKGLSSYDTVPYDSAEKAYRRSLAIRARDAANYPKAFSEKQLNAQRAGAARLRAYNAAKKKAAK